VNALKPRGERRDDISVVVARLKQRVASIPGMTVVFSRCRTSRSVPSEPLAVYQYTLTGTDSAQVVLWATRLVAELRRDPLFRDVSSARRRAGFAGLDVNRQRAGQLASASRP